MTALILAILGLTIVLVALGIIQLTKPAETASWADLDRRLRSAELAHQFIAEQGLRRQFGRWQVERQDRFSQLAAAEQRVAELVAS